MSSRSTPDHSASSACVIPFSSAIAAKSRSRLLFLDCFQCLVEFVEGDFFEMVDMKGYILWAVNYNGSCSIWKNTL